MYNLFDAAVAQPVERVLGKDEVTGSNPVSSSLKEVLCGECCRATPIRKTISFLPVERSCAHTPSHLNATE